MKTTADISRLLRAATVRNLTVEGLKAHRQRLLAELEVVNGQLAFLGEKPDLAAGENFRKQASSTMDLALGPFSGYRNPINT